MRYVGKIATIAALIVAVATPALAGRATSAERLELQKKTKACKLEASKQVRMHVMEKRAFIKTCVARA